MEEHKGNPTQQEEHQSNSTLPLEANFLALVRDFSVQAMIYLGRIENPFSQSHEKDLEKAKYMIDLLGILEEKTSGNLTPDEEGVLGATLQQLRLAFVEEQQGESQGIPIEEQEYEVHQKQEGEQESQQQKPLEEGS